MVQDFKAPSWKAQGELRSPGIRSGGMPLLTPMIVVPSEMTDTCGSTWMFLDEQCVAPFAPPYPGLGVTREWRLFAAFGMDGAGTSTARECDFDEIFLDYCFSIRSSWQDDPSIVPGALFPRIFVPAYLFAYAITAPWNVLQTASVGGFSGIPWASQPPTNYSLNGNTILNPTTGLIDNYLGIHKIVYLLHNETTPLGYVGALARSAMWDSRNATFYPWDLIPPVPWNTAPYTRLIRMCVDDRMRPTGSIYGIMFKLVSIIDCYRAGLQTTVSSSILQSPLGEPTAVARDWYLVASPSSSLVMTDASIPWDVSRVSASTLPSPLTSEQVYRIGIYNDDQQKYLKLADL